MDEEEKPLVVDLKNIDPVDSVDKHSEEYNYHGGGFKRAKEKLDLRSVAEELDSNDFEEEEGLEEKVKEEVPEWAQKEIIDTFKEEEMKENIKEYNSTLDNLDSTDRGSDEWERFNNLSMEIDSTSEKLKKKLDEGEFETPTGKIGKRDLINSSLQSFVKGVLSKNMASAKEDMDEETFDTVKELGNRRSKLTEMFDKSFFDITEEELKEKIGEGEVFENDLLMLKAYKGNLSDQDIKEAEEKGVIGEPEKNFFEQIKATGGDIRDRMVYSSAGVSDFSKTPILVESEQKISEEKPVDTAIISPRDMRQIYINADEVSKEGEGREEIEKRVNTFNEAKKLAKKYEDTLSDIDIDKEKNMKERADHPEIGNLAEEEGENEGVLGLSHKIVNDSESFQLDEYEEAEGI